MKKNIFKFLIVCNVWAYSAMGYDNENLESLCDTYNDIIWSKTIKLPSLEEVKNELSNLLTEEVVNPKFETDTEFSNFCEKLKEDSNNQRFDYFIDLYKDIYPKVDDREKFVIYMLIDGVNEKSQKETIIFNRKKNVYRNQDVLKNISFEDLEKKYENS